MNNINKSARPVRVMIVDDSAVIRSIIEKILSSDTEIEVCGYAANGEQAVKAVETCKPDIILLDIEMPVMDGVTAIPLILEKKKDVKIIMCSTLSASGAEISIKAMSLGAADCILKPSGSGSIQGSQNFHANLLRMVRDMGRTITHASTPATSVTTRPKQIVFNPKIVAIGSSTGGPNALETVLKSMGKLNVPVVITQHIPPTFSRIMAAHLTKATGLECVEVDNGMTLKPGKVYIARGEYHLHFKQDEAGTETVLDEGPAEHFCRPAVDAMFRSLAHIYKGNILTVILTGMGEDGLKGARKLVEEGSYLIAQDKNTSVVWGMPGAVAEAGICNEILPLEKIGPTISTLCRGARA